MVTMALGRADCQAMRNVASVPATSITRSAPPVRGDTSHGIEAFIGRYYRYAGILSGDKLPPPFVEFTHYDMPWVREHHALQCAQSGGAGSDYQHSVVAGYFRYSGRPEPCGEYVASQQSLPVGHVVGDYGQAVVGMRHSHVFALPAVDAASERPSSVGRCAVVDPSVAAEETLAAEGLDIDRYPVARLYVVYRGSGLFDDADHFVAYRYARPGFRHAAVQDVQVGRAYARQSDADDRVIVVDYFRDRFVGQFKNSRCGIGQCFHRELVDSVADYDGKSNEYP